MATEPPAKTPWYDTVLAVLKANQVEIVAYVPDKVLAPLIARLHADPYFTMIPVAREEEGLGIATGAWMGGKRTIVLMQTSGFATLPNVLASLVIVCQIPAILMISERGTMGDHQLAQAIVCRTLVPTLQTLGVEHHRITRPDETEFICDRTIQQAYKTQAPAALILSPLLTNNPAWK
ncbi:MAG: decarboxylase [Burkholderiales bacterium]|nr:decarboxylase [Burkholderiales bacterium]